MSPQPVDLRTHGGRHTRWLLFLWDTSPPLAGLLSVAASATGSRTVILLRFRAPGSDRVPSTPQGIRSRRDEFPCWSNLHRARAGSDEPGIGSLPRLYTQADALIQHL